MYEVLDREIRSGKSMLIMVHSESEWSIGIYGRRMFKNGKQ